NPASMCSLPKNPVGTRMQKPQWNINSVAEVCCDPSTEIVSSPTEMSGPRRGGQPLREGQGSILKLQGDHPVSRVEEDAKTQLRRHDNSVEDMEVDGVDKENASRFRTEDTGDQDSRQNDGNHEDPDVDF